MSASGNPVLRQVLHRRRMRRRARLAAAAWVFFGGLHIAVWWAAFNSGGNFGPDGEIWQTDILQLAVWPLLLAASISFVVMMVYGLRWFYAPGNPQEFDWLERTDNSSPRPSEEGEDRAPAEDTPGPAVVSAQG